VPASVPDARRSAPSASASRFTQPSGRWSGCHGLPGRMQSGVRNLLDDRHPIMSRAPTSAGPVRTGAEEKAQSQPPNEQNRGQHPMRLPAPPGSCNPCRKAGRTADVGKPDGMDCVILMDEIHASCSAANCRDGLISQLVADCERNLQPGLTKCKNSRLEPTNLLKAWICRVRGASFNLFFTGGFS